MGKPIISLPKKFPIKLTCDPALILDPTIGGHKQYVIRANGLELVRSIDESLAFRIVDFLKKTNFACFIETTQGHAIMEKIYLLSEKEKLKPETDGNGHIIIRSLDQPEQ
jgi:hypothetical protein